MNALLVNQPRVIGVDIGGANLKYACSDDEIALAGTFAMWRRPDDLSSALEQDLATLGGNRVLAVTMTGELADCFVDRQEGVQHIVRHVQRAASSLSIETVLFYGVDGEFYIADDAIEKTDLIAAGNWHALANFVGQKVQADALLVDIGSTTTDIIPIAKGCVATKAKTDFDRLLEGSLVYLGCRRTPVCGVVDRLTFHGQIVPVMNELFATMDDASLVLGKTRPNADDTDSADGKPRTVEFAANRLARMIGLDRRSVSVDEAIDLARQVVAAASEQISQAISRSSVNVDHVPIVQSGHGHELYDLSALGLSPNHTAIDLSDSIGKEASRAAPAYAVAKLLAYRLK
ncbi:MAG: hydantoinase/oxoprolinase family protein [Pirellulaceae bacterium]